MARRDEHHAFFKAEEVVVVGLASDVGVGPGAQGVVDERCARSAAEGHRPDGASEGGAVAQAGGVESGFHAVEEGGGRFRLGQAADEAAHGVEAVGAVLRREAADVGQPEPVGHGEADAARRVVQVGMGRIDSHAELDGQAHAAFGLCGVADALQAMEQERMVSHDEVAPRLGRRAHCGFGHV